MEAYYIKTIKADNKRDIEREYELQKIASNYGFCPKVYELDLKYNEDEKKWTGVIKMEHLNALCLADVYSDDPKKIPKNVWDQIRTILETLLHEEGIEYIDITSYNFIEKNGKVYIIDFGHAKYYKTENGLNWFLSDFLDGENNWNPDFY